jgi:hypothetical protein
MYDMSKVIHPSNQDHPLLKWTEDRDLFLQELLRHEGRGDYMHDTVCKSCHSGAPQFRCRDCFGTELCCHSCIVASHANNPAHRIQVRVPYSSYFRFNVSLQEWTGIYFVPVSLKKLGLRVQLGHPAGEYCLLPQKAFNDDFTLIHTNGIHEIGLDYCGCETAERHVKQLLRTAWFPATSTDPRTAATFTILEQYHLLSFESKASGYEFYHSLARLTDNTGLRPRKVCLTRQYNIYLTCFTRIVTRHLCVLSASGDILRCSSEQAEVMTPLVWGILRVASVPCCVQPVRNLVETFLTSGKRPRKKQGTDNFYLHQSR